MEKKKKKRTGLTVLTGRKIQLHSQTLSNYRLTRRLLPAPFGAWAGMTLIIQPGLSELLRKSHIDARPSVGARSTWMMNSQESRSQAIHRSKPCKQLQLQTRATMPGDEYSQQIALL